MQEAQQQEPVEQQTNISEIIIYYLQLYEQKMSIENVPQEDQPKRSYSLYEDLKLILECGSIPDIHNKHFHQIEEKKIINRSYNSIRDRYTHFLIKLTDEDFNKIGAHLQQHGAQGYLLFSNAEKNKYLIDIVLQDPKSMPMQQERRKHAQIEGQPQKKTRLSENEFSEHIPSEAEQKHQEGHKKQKQAKQQDKTFPKNQFDKFDLEDLDDVLTLIAQWKRVPKVLIVEKLHELSGNLNDLDVYLNTLNEEHCWLEEEDMLLAQSKSKHSPEIRLLTRKKGLERVLRRVKYLKYQLPFEFD